MKHAIIITFLTISVLVVVINKPKEVIKKDSKKEYFELKSKINHVAKLTKCDSG